MKKGTDDFLFVLVAAVVVLVIFFLLSSFFPTGTLTPGGGDLETLIQYSPGIVGFSSESTSQTIDFGDFTVGDDQAENFKTITMLEVYSGITGQKQEEFLAVVDKTFLDQAKRIRISFDLPEATPAGRLLVDWNGKQVHAEALEPGKYEFVVPHSTVVEENRVVVSAEGPGIFFWATTKYVLRNFKADVIYGPAKIVPFQLTEDELETFDRGEVSFFGFSDNELTVKINGVALYSKTPQGTEVVPFDLTTAPIRVGNNVLSFSGDSINLRSVKLDIFVLGNRLIKTKTFELTEEQKNTIDTNQKRAKLTFDVQQFIKSGVMEVTINDKKLNIQIIQRGENSVDIPKEFLQEGKNSIQFSGTGTWKLGLVKVGLTGPF